MLFISDEISTVLILRLSRIRSSMCSTQITVRWPPRAYIIDSRPPFFGNFHPFENYPLAQRVITIMKRYSSVF